MNRFAPERVLALIARLLTGDAERATREIARDCLWDHVATTACERGLGGLVLRALSQVNIEAPAPAGLQLDGFARYVAANNAYKVSRSAPMLAALERGRVPFLLLKGAALNATVYDSPDLRPMLDIDVLIRPEDAARADKLLLDAGCDRGPALLREDFYPKYYYEREYLTPSRPQVKLDVHVRPFRPLRYAATVPDDALWRDPLRVAFGGIDAGVPDPAAMLIHLAVHAACHGLNEPRWLYDIHLWADRFAGSIDERDLFDRARAWRLAVPVRRALERTAATFGDPAGRLAGAARRLSGLGLADRMILRQAPRDLERPVTGVLINLLTAPGLGLRLGYLRAVLMPDADHLRQLYPRRHRGWQCIAHLARLRNTLARLLPRSAPSPA